MGETPIATLHGFAGTDAREHNGHLIAAAPELLDALRALLIEADSVTIAAGGIPTVSDRWPAAAAARRAIAKATGRL